MLTLACGLEIVIALKLGALILGALGLTKAAAAVQEEEPCSGDC